MFAIAFLGFYFKFIQVLIVFFLMGLSAPDLLVLNAASVPKETQTMPLAKRKIWLSTMRKQLLELCFSTSATELSMESAAPTSAVICIENGRPTTTGVAYRELIFFGNSALCLNHALHCSGMADSIMVIGTRSREHVALQLDFYLLQLMKSIDPLGC